MTNQPSVTEKHRLELAFDQELTVLENKYLKLGIEPDYLADTLRASGNSMDLWRRRLRMEEG